MIENVLDFLKILVCTTDWNAHYPCHYLWLWIKYHGPESINDYRCFIDAFNIIVIAVTAQLLASFEKSLLRKGNVLIIFYPFLGGQSPFDLWHNSIQSLAHDPLAGLALARDFRPSRPTAIGLDSEWKLFSMPHSHYWVGGVFPVQLDCYQSDLLANSL